MRSLFDKVKYKILNNELEYYIMPLYQDLLFIKKICIGFLRILRGSILIKKSKGLGKKLPTVLQLPITGKCNLKCKMCNVPSMNDNKDFIIIDLKNAFKDKVFSRIKSVGVNGGEPFLKNNLEEYIETLFLLPNLKDISIISNGVLSSQILKKLELIYSMCRNKGVKLNVTFSIDGYGEKHDEIRGIKGSFVKTIDTIKSIQINKGKYCDNLGVICTISRYNIYSLSQLESYFKVNNLPKISYQLAIQHKRLSNEDLVEEFSIMNDKHMKMVAREFFFSKYCETKEVRYYYIFKYILNNFSNRMLSCMWQSDAITIDASGNICYCAVESDKIGAINDANIYGQVFKKQNLEYRKNIIESKCNNCIHYSDSKPYIKSYIEACLFELNRIKWPYRYLRVGGRMK
ncbi:MAG: radical SAM protein [Bacillota bacterium]